LVDVGYPNEYRFLGLYKGERYHLPDLQRHKQPKSRKEVFNRAHFLIRSVIVLLDYGKKKDGKFYKACSHMLTKHKFKLLWYQ